MKRTPDGVSKARQKLGQEIEVWRRAIKKVKIGQPDAAQKISFGEMQIDRCAKAMKALYKDVGKKQFWENDTSRKRLTVRSRYNKTY